MYLSAYVVNFAVSGNAVEWYFKNTHNNYKSYCCRPCSRLMTRHWGSVAGGSFLNAFLMPFDMVSDCFRVPLSLTPVLS